MSRSSKPGDVIEITRMDNFYTEFPIYALTVDGAAGRNRMMLVGRYASNLARHVGMVPGDRFQLSDHPSSHGIELRIVPPDQ